MKIYKASLAKIANLFTYNLFVLQLFQTSNRWILVGQEDLMSMDIANLKKSEVCAKNSNTFFLLHTINILLL